MDFLKCNDCGEIFEQIDAGEKVEIEENEAWGQISGTFVFISTCCACGSEEVEDYTKCETDDCWSECILGVDECASCFAMYSPNDFADYAKKWPQDLPAEYRPVLHS